MEKFYRHPVLIIAVLLLLTVFFALQLPKVEMDNNMANALARDNPIRLKMDRVDEIFGSSLGLMVGLERQFGTVYDPEFLIALKDFVDKVKEITIVDQASSLVNMDYITSDDESIVIKNLVEDDFSGSQAEIAELQRRISSWSALQNLVSEDNTSTFVSIVFPLPITASHDPIVIEAIREIRGFAECFDGKATVYFTGQAILTNEVTAAMSGDLRLLIPLVIVLVVCVLFFSFRRVSGIVLPLVTVIIAVIWTMGLMGLCGVKVTIVSILIPVILVAIGSAYGIHIVSHYFDDAGNRSLSKEEHRELVFSVLRKMIKPVSLASLTTIAGFVSFLFTTILPLRDFGIFNSVGTLAAFVIALTLIPSLLLLRGPPAARTKGKRNSGAVNAALIANGDALGNAIGAVFFAIAQRKRLVLFITAVLVAVSFFGASKVVVDNSMIDYFRPASEVVRADNFINRKFAGSNSIDIIIEADSARTLLSPEVLGPLDALNAWLVEQVPAVGQVSGFTDMVKRINQVFNADESPAGLSPANRGAGTHDDDAMALGDFGFDDFDTSALLPNPDTALPAAPRKTFGERLREYSAGDMLAMLDTAAGEKRNASGADIIRSLERQVNYEGLSYYEIPTDPQRYGMTSGDELRGLVSNYLVLLGGGIDRVANDPIEPTAIRSSVMLKNSTGANIRLVEKAINDFAAAALPGNVALNLSGGSILQNEVNDNVVNSQIISLLIAIVSVFIIIAVSNRSFSAGLIGSLPLVISILVNFMVMGFAGIKLNLATALIASLTIGIGVDYVIHFMEAFKREHTAAHGGGDFLRAAFVSSGKAILVNAVSVGGGFLMLVFSNLSFLGEMGLLFGLTMALSALLSLTLIPVLLITIKPKFIYKG
jgi:predicted RND superfamily exporter protein